MHKPGADSSSTRRVVLAVAAASALLALAGCVSASYPVTNHPVDIGRALAAVNAFRARNGRAPLTASAQLTEAAATQARAMARQDRTNHSAGGRLITRIKATGYEPGVAAENVAAGQPTLEAAVAAWIRSPGHRRNLLDGNVTELGIAAADSGGSHGRYWALVLASPMPEEARHGPALGPFKTSDGGTLSIFAAPR